MLMVLYSLWLHRLYNTIVLYAKLYFMQMLLSLHKFSTFRNYSWTFWHPMCIFLFISICYFIGDDDIIVWNDKFCIANYTKHVFTKNCLCIVINNRSHIPYSIYMSHYIEYGIWDLTHLRRSLVLRMTLVFEIIGQLCIVQ